MHKKLVALPASLGPLNKNAERPQQAKQMQPLVPTRGKNVRIERLQVNRAVGSQHLVVNTLIIKPGLVCYFPLRPPEEIFIDDLCIKSVTLVYSLR